MEKRQLKIFIIILAALLLLVGVFVSYRFISKKDDSAQNVSIEPLSSGAPKLQVSSVINDLRNPWEIVFLPDQMMLFTERSGAISKIVDGKKVIIHSPDDVVARGEGGMLGLAVDPDFTSNGYIYSCFNSDLENLDIRVARWRLNKEQNSLEDRRDIVTGIPANPSGRHSGCRIGFGPDGNLWIGTGDAAQSSNSQDLSSLGGKILRVTREGVAAEGDMGGGADSRIYSYGHRNTQGLAFYNEIKNGAYGYSVEHGSDRDDEVNALVPGNFGWDPGAGYDESVPMTDRQKFPDSIEAFWSSGNPTIAPADAVILEGDRWGDWDGFIAMAVLKDKHLRLLSVEGGKLGSELKLLEKSYGRLRATTTGPDGSLYISTDNGSNDQILKITPVLE